MKTLIRFKINISAERQPFVRCMQNEHKILSVIAIRNLHKHYCLTLKTKKRLVIHKALQRF